jgi:hypothetical protein
MPTTLDRCVGGDGKRCFIPRITPPPPLARKRSFPWILKKSKLAGGCQANSNFQNQILQLFDRLNMAAILPKQCKTPKHSNNQPTTLGHDLQNTLQSALLGLLPYVYGVLILCNWLCFFFLLSTLYNVITYGRWQCKPPSLSYFLVMN